MLDAENGSNFPGRLRRGWLAGGRARDSAANLRRPGVHEISRQQQAALPASAKYRPAQDEQPINNNADSSAKEPSPLSGKLRKGVKSTKQKNNGTKGSSGTHADSEPLQARTDKGRRQWEPCNEPKYSVNRGDRSLTACGARINSRNVHKEVMSFGHFVSRRSSPGRPICLP